MATREMLPFGQLPPPVWAAPATRPVLGAADVHVWRAGLDLDPALLTPLTDTLSIDERGRATRYSSPLHRDRWVAARGILRRILARYLRTDPALIRFSYGAHGKPAVEGGDGDGLCFTLSHAGGLALYAVTMGRRVGIDVEVPRHDLDIEAIGARHFSAAEARALAAQSAGRRAEAFFRCWTRKEAYIKALGLGLTCPLGRFTVSLGPQPALLADADDPGAPGRWSLHALEPGSGYVAALAVESLACHLSCWGWAPEAP